MKVPISVLTVMFGLATIGCERDPDPVVTTTRGSIDYLTGHGPPITSVAISEARDLIAWADVKGKIVIRRLRTLKKVKELILPNTVVSCLAFNSDGKFLYAANVDNYELLQIRLRDYSQLRLHLGPGGTLLLSAPFDGDKKLVTVTAGNTLLVHRLHSVNLPAKNGPNILKLLQEKRIPGGFIREAILSRSRRFLAVTSENEVDNRSAPPRKLTIFDLKGKAEASYTFESVFAYSSSTASFSRNSDALLLYTASRPIREFRFKKKEQQWAVTTMKIEPSKSYGTASCVSDDGTLFVAAGDRIMFLDTTQKRLCLLASVDVKRGGEFAEDIIQALVWIPNPSRLLGVLIDGRIAVLRLRPQATSGGAKKIQAAPATRKGARHAEAEREGG